LLFDSSIGACVMDTRADACRDPVVEIGAASAIAIRNFLIATSFLSAIRSKHPRKPGAARIETRSAFRCASVLPHKRADRHHSGIEHPRHERLGGEHRIDAAVLMMSRHCREGDLDKLTLLEIDAFSTSRLRTAHAEAFKAGGADFFADEKALGSLIVMPLRRTL